MRPRSRLAVSTAVVVAATTLPATARAAGAAGTAPVSGCPSPFPVSKVTDGMTGWGLTVSKGTTPERFEVKVAGVLQDGIAPGIDMIVVSTESPAIDKARGIWEGMSGSPVYAADGRILGAISYGFSTGPSKLAGITPAAAMLDELKRPGAVPQAQERSHVALPATLRKKIVRGGAADARQAAQGLAPLRVPVAVSGLNSARLKRYDAELTKHDADARLYAAANSAGAPAPAGAITPGGNFAAMQVYGDAGYGGVGTTTMVCDGQALAFGHPFTLRGAVRMSAHAADAVAVVDDPTTSPYKMANIGGIAGTLTRDRTAAITARLGAGPAGTKVTATVAADGMSRTGTSVVNMTQDVPGGAGLHLQSDIDRAFDRIGGGGATATVSVSGTAGGRAWTLSRTNRYADRADVGYLPVTELVTDLATIEQNPFSGVRFTKVSVKTALNDTFGQYGIVRAYAKPGKKWIRLTPDTSLSLKAGAKLPVKVNLSAYRASGRTVTFTVTVPKKRKGSAGELNIAGGNTAYPGDPACLAFGNADCAIPVPAASFSGLVKRLRTLPRNDDLLAAFSFGGSSASATPAATVRLDKIVDSGDDGGLTVPITIT